MWKASGVCFRDVREDPGDKSCVEINESQQIGSDLPSMGGYRSVILKGPKGSFTLFLISTLGVLS